MVLSCPFLEAAGFCLTKLPGELSIGASQVWDVVAHVDRWPIIGAKQEGRADSKRNWFARLPDGFSIH